MPIPYKVIPDYEPEAAVNFYESAVRHYFKQDLQLGKIQMAHIAEIYFRHMALNGLCYGDDVNKRYKNLKKRVPLYFKLLLTMTQPQIKSLLSLIKNRKNLTENKNKAISDYWNTILLHCRKIVNENSISYTNLRAKNRIKELMPFDETTYVIKKMKNRGITKDDDIRKYVKRRVRKTNATRRALASRTKDRSKDKV